MFNAQLYERFNVKVSKFSSSSTNEKFIAPWNYRAINLSNAGKGEHNLKVIEEKCFLTRPSKTTCVLNGCDHFRAVYSEW